MFSKILKFFIVLIVLFNSSIAQENAELEIAPGLRECYLDPYLSIKDNLLPHTIETLINLIQKIENAPGLNQGISQLSVSIIHRFRQDGIVRLKDVSASNVVLPYSASQFHSGKHNLLLTKLLPGNVNNFPNDTLSSIERCTLHSMLSSTVLTDRRGDEGQVCNKLANYRAMRVPRSLKRSEKNLKENSLNDVEFIDKTQGKKKPETYGKMQFFENDNEDYGDDYDDVGVTVDQKEPVDRKKKKDTEIINSSSAGQADKSECPVENGVVKTIWGTISPGNVINGIATGLQNQRVSLNILMGERRRAHQQNSLYIDNRWASTLAGDLAEVVLLQVAADARPESINIGGPGAWNSSALPKWYFLSQRDKFEMTDAEIRGGIDGLIIANKIKEWQNSVSDLKLSQVLKMYYSQEGVLESGIRACDRKKFFDEMIKPEELKKQTAAFSKLLKTQIGRVTIHPNGFSQLSDIAADLLLSYIRQSLNDLSCESSKPNPNVIETDISTDLVVFIDTAWPYKEIKDLIGYILTQINLNPKTSSVAVFDAMEANQIANTTSDLSTVFKSWNLEDYQRRRTGINLPNVFMKLQNVTSGYMNSEKVNSSAGGNSLVGLIVPYTSGVDGDSNAAWERVQILREDIPDIRILFFTNGPVTRFERFVIDKKKDLIPAQSSSDPVAVAKPVVDRIKELSRRVINPRCGAEWTNGETGTVSLKQCVGPGSVKYYRLISNYFFSDNGNRKLKIQAQQGTSTLTVCVTRELENPRSNTTLNKPDDLECKQIITNAFELELPNPCYGNYEIHNCNPYYISVEASDYVGSGMIISDPECENPNEIPFKITTEHLTCHSGVERLFKNSFLIIIVSYILVLW